MDKPDLPTNCREHANGRVVSVQRQLENGECAWELAKFLCGCCASVSSYTAADGLRHWSLSETIFWKEGQG